MLKKSSRKVLSSSPMNNKKSKPKCKEWERRRREKLNDAFKVLSQLLPNYDPAKNLAKIEILERSTEFVKDLRLSNSRLVSHQSETDEKCKLIQELQDEVNKLILRVKQLTTLLKLANIPIPIGPCINSLGQRKLKWSDKITLNGESIEDTENVNIQGAWKSKDSSSDKIKEIEPISAEVPLKETITDPNTNPDSGQTRILIYTNANSTSSPNISQSTKTNPILSTQKQKKSPAKKTKTCPENIINVSVSQIPCTSTTTSTLTLPQLSTSSSTFTAVLAEPSKPTEPTILPMQTFILTSCPIGSTVLNSSPLTRIALGPTRLMSDVGYSFHNNFVQKIPISSIRKPIPKIKKKRKRRQKNVIIEEVTITASKSELNKSFKDNSEKSVIEITQTPIPQSSIEQTGDILEKESQKIKLAEKQTDLEDHPNLEESNKDSTTTENGPQNIKDDTIIIKPNESSDLMQIQLYAQDPIDKELEEIELSSAPTKVPSHEPVNLQEIDKENEVASDDLEDRVITNIDKPVSTNNEITLIQNNPVKPQTKLILEQIQDNNSPESIIKSANNKTHWEPIQDKATFDQNMDIDQIPTPNQETSSETVNGDKISECIARSIDLIDAPDGELMELGDNWGDNANSPKSPISPTQMFLNMFPLLPRESIGTGAEGSQQIVPTTIPLPSNSRAPTYSSSSHRSFFIDSFHRPEETVHQISGNRMTASRAADLEFTPNVLKTTPPQQEKFSSKTIELISSTIRNVTDNTNTSHLKSIPISSSSSSTIAKTIMSNTTSSFAKFSEDSHRLSSQPQYHPLVQSQHNFKDLNIFSDSMDFTPLGHPFSDHELFRDNTKSRGIFDSSFNLEFNAPQPVSEQLHNMEIPDHFQNFQQPTSRESSARFDTFSANYASSSKSNNNQTQPTPQTVSKCLPIFPNTFNNTPPHNTSISLPSQHNELPPVPVINQSRPQKISNITSSTSFPTVTTLTTQSKKTSPPKPSPACNQNQALNVSKNLFRPQVTELAQNQVTSGHSDYYSLSRRDNIQETATSTHRAQFYSSLPGFTPETRHVNNAQLQPSQKNSSEKKQSNSKKPTNKAARESTNVSVTSISNKSRKENVKESQPKKTPANKGRSKAVQQFSENALHSQTPAIRNSTAAVGITPTPEIFGSAPQSHFFGHSLQNSDQHSNILSEFSLPPDNNNVHYDHYNMDFNFSSNANHQQFQHHQAQNIPQQQPQHQSHPPQQQQAVVVSQPPSSSTRTRPTPFYLQDVNCDTFDFHGQNLFPQPQNQSQYNRNPSATQKSHHPHQFQPSPTNVSANSHCYQSPQQLPLPNQQHCQNVNYPNVTSVSSRQGSNQNNNANAQTNRQNPTSHSSVVQQLVHSGGRDTSEPTKNYGTGSNPVNQVKPKPPTANLSVVQNNQSHQSPSQSTQSRSATIASVSAPVSHRPVNWMTDSNAAPASQQNIFRKTTTSATNPFSVSKLVGTGNINVNPGSNAPIVPQLPNPINRHSGSSTNYCEVEALIKKNPTSSGNAWSTGTSSHVKPQQSHTFFQPSGVSSHSHPNMPMHHQVNSTFSPHSSHNPSSSGAINSNFNDDFNLSGYQYHHNPSQTMNLPHNFGSFDSMQHHSLSQQDNNNHGHQQFHFQPHGHHHQAQPNMSMGSGTSSVVSNFNLSTIFPEINDKRQAPVGSSGIPRSSGNSSTSTSVGTRNSSNNCGYYPQQQAPGHSK